MKDQINTSPPPNITIYERDKSDIFKITEDKLRLKLTDLEKSIENKTAIFSYLGIAISITVALLTSSFNDFIFSAELWKAIFIVALVFMICLLIKNLVSFIRNKKDISGIIKDIKAQQS